MTFLKKPYRFAILYSILLTCLSAYALLDAFVIPKGAVHVPSQAVQPPHETAKAVATDTSYRDANIQITIEKGRAFDSNYYVADIVLSSADFLKTALANNTYGRNIRQTTSEIAKARDAILAINGDYYGFRDTGVVLRNGVLYRGAGHANSGDALLIDAAGNLSVVDETTLSDADLKARGIQQALSFGPGLVVNGRNVVDAAAARGQVAEQNPRTAIGQISELHYVVIVVDGRTSASRGVTLEQLAELFVRHGAKTAYNLDGGGSSSLVFGGKLINQPTDGRTSGERRVSDIVYFGHE